VKSVFVNECEVTDENMCILDRGEKYFMDVKFLPEFGGSNLTLLAYANIAGRFVEFDEMNSNACDFMKCPIESGTEQSYIFHVKVELNKPRGKFNVRWLMKQNNENRCCFMNKFQIE
jgi:hypothetical protein